MLSVRRHERGFPAFHLNARKHSESVLAWGNLILENSSSGKVDFGLPSCLTVRLAVSSHTRHRGQPQPSSSSSASSITSPPPSPLYCRAFLLLLPPFSIVVTVAITVSVFLLPPPYSVCHHRHYRLRLPPTSTIFCLIVVCCRSSSLFVVVLSPFSSSRSSPAPAPHSSAPATDFLPSLLSLSCLFDCCVHPRQIRRTLFLLCRHITNVQSGHRRRCHHRRRRHGCRGSSVCSAGDGQCFHHRLCRRCLGSHATAGDGSPPPATAVRHVALARSFSFSVPVVRIFSSLAASLTRPRRFASTVAAPPRLLVQKYPLLLFQKVYCCVGRTESDVVDVAISSQIVAVFIASPPSSSRSAASSKPLPDNRRYVAG